RAAGLSDEDAHRAAFKHVKLIGRHALAELHRIGTRLPQNTITRGLEQRAPEAPGGPRPGEGGRPVALRIRASAGYVLVAGEGGIAHLAVSGETLRRTPATAARTKKLRGCEACWYERAFA